MNKQAKGRKKIRLYDMMQNPLSMKPPRGTIFDNGNILIQDADEVDIVGVLSLSHRQIENAAGFLYRSGQKWPDNNPIVNVDRSQDFLAVAKEIMGIKPLEFIEDTKESTNGLWSIELVPDPDNPGSFLVKLRYVDPLAAGDGRFIRKEPPLNSNVIDVQNGSGHGLIIQRSTTGTANVAALLVSQTGGNGQAAEFRSLGGNQELVNLAAPEGEANYLTIQDTDAFNSKRPVINQAQELVTKMYSGSLPTPGANHLHAIAYLNEATLASDNGLYVCAFVPNSAAYAWFRAKGDQGDPGQDGIDGIDGLGIDDARAVAVAAGGQPTATIDDTTVPGVRTLVVGAVTGNTGSTGLKGDTGDDGGQGPKGDKGDPGDCECAEVPDPPGAATDQKRCNVSTGVVDYSFEKFEDMKDAVGAGITGGLGTADIISAFVSQIPIFGFLVSATISAISAMVTTGIAAINTQDTAEFRENVHCLLYCAMPDSGALSEALFASWLEDVENTQAVPVGSIFAEAMRAIGVVEFRKRALIYVNNEADCAICGCDDDNGICTSVTYVASAPGSNPVEVCVDETFTVNWPAFEGHFDELITFTKRIKLSLISIAGWTDWNAGENWGYETTPGAGYALFNTTPAAPGNVFIKSYAANSSTAFSMTFLVDEIEQP